jgi:glutathione synthase/RimK-type ligase-like ATP-grasp enzyme
MIKRQNTYYLGLFDLDIIAEKDIDGVNIYKNVEFRKSGNQEYFIILDKNLQERKNWYKLNNKQVIKSKLIDFSFTNWSKIQTTSVIHNRILLDKSEHFISNKMHYYNTFKNEEFIPKFTNISNINDLPNKIDELTILKPSTGSLSIGIKILDTHNTRDDIIEHINTYKNYKNWIISELYIAKLWIDGCIVSNRIYYLVRKIIIKGEIHVTGYWYDEPIHYKASAKYNKYETNYKSIKQQLITNMSNNETIVEDFFIKRVLSHAQYLKLFTENEYKIIKNKITNYLKIITKKIFEHITCSNDYINNYNDETDENKNMTFHLYGVDSLIMDNLDVKFIEINGAPSIIYEAALIHINYNVMFDELLKLTADIFYPPYENIKYNNSIDNNGPHYGKFIDSLNYVKMFDRKFIECGNFSKSLKIPIYISKQICDIYPFIEKGLLNDKRKYIYQRIKNVHSNNIFLFYGLRDRYIHNESSLNFYDEIIEYRISNNGHKAKILNKIQGITYHLASKDRLYFNCHSNNFIPNSFVFDIDNDIIELLQQNILKCISNKSKYIIIKPVYGSQGKGIIIIPYNTPIDVIFNAMNTIKRKFNYNIFIISIYINNPKLYTDTLTNKFNIKFNLRFYTLIHLNKLATYKNPINKINYYILNDVQIYFAVLQYNLNINDVTNELIKVLNINDNYIEIYEKIKSLPISDINNLMNLTNLQMIKNLACYLNIDIPLNNYITSLEQMNYNSELKNNIFTQANHIIKTTIDSVKYDIRHLNRFIDESSAFNLIAYDTMLDSNDKLHLIEINRGPDLLGLSLTLGDTKITNVFSEIFDIVIDNKPNTELNYFTKFTIEY